MKRVLGISGSLRSGSFNTALLRVAGRFMPDDVTFEIFDLSAIPLYNGDVERDIGFPEPVEAFREAITAADGLLIASPEYNWSVTGVLKNAIDWASRGGSESPLNRKPAAIMGAGGRSGTARSQAHLREVLMHNDVHVLATPEVLVASAYRKFDDDGRLTDEEDLESLGNLVLAFVEILEKAGSDDATEGAAAS